MQVIVPFISPKVLRAGQSLSEKTQNCKKRVTGDLLVDLLKLSGIDSLLALEAHLKDLVHVVHGLAPLLKVVQTSSLLGELSLDAKPSLAIVFGIDDGQAGEDRGNIIFGDKPITVEVVNFEDEINLLVEARAVETEESCQELPLIEVPVLVGVHDIEKALPQDPWQLRIIKEGHLVDAFGGLIRPRLQVLENVLEIRKADLGFEVLVRLQLYKLKLVIAHH